jgi:hypothetical protein
MKLWNIFKKRGLLRLLVLVVTGVRAAAAAVLRGGSGGLPRILRPDQIQIENAQNGRVRIQLAGQKK